MELSSHEQAVFRPLSSRHRLETRLSSHTVSRRRGCAEKRMRPTQHPPSQPVLPIPTFLSDLGGRLALALSRPVLGMA